MPPEIHLRVLITLPINKLLFVTVQRSVALTRPPNVYTLTALSFLVTEKECFLRMNMNVARVCLLFNLI